MSEQSDLHEVVSSILMHREGFEVVETAEEVQATEPGVDVEADRRYFAEVDARMELSAWITPRGCADLVSSICPAGAVVEPMGNKASVVAPLPFGRLVIQSTVGYWDENFESEELDCAIELTDLYFNNPAGLIEMNKSFKWATATEKDSRLSFHRVISLANGRTDRSMLTELSRFYHEVESACFKLLR